MRKFIFIATAFLFILQIVNFGTSGALSAAISPIEYYRITSESATFYRTDSGETDTENVYCTLPESYFVKAKTSESGDYIAVSFLGVDGFVKSSDVVPVYSTPTTPYPLRTFDINHTASAVVWSEPNTDSTYVGCIEYDTTDVLYLGEILGQKITPTDSGVWYLCKFGSSASATSIGYVYSSLTNNLTEFVPNIEEVLLEPVADTSGSILAPEFTQANSILLILLLTIPAVIILVLIIRPKRTKQQAAKRQIATLNELSKFDKNKPDEFDF